MLPLLVASRRGQAQSQPGMGKDKCQSPEIEASPPLPKDAVESGN